MNWVAAIGCFVPQLITVYPPGTMPLPNGAESCWIADATKYPEEYMLACQGRERIECTPLRPMNAVPVLNCIRGVQHTNPCPPLRSPGDP